MSSDGMIRVQVLEGEVSPGQLEEFLNSGAVGHVIAVFPITRSEEGFDYERRNSGGLDGDYLKKVPKTTLHTEVYVVYRALERQNEA